VGRDRIYYDNAERQRAYRERQREELERLRNAGTKRQLVSAKLIKVLGLLESDHAGERAIALAASRILKEAGLTWHDVLDVPRGKK
jgi:hypothetical protein